jgi:hypothetical protein
VKGLENAIFPAADFSIINVPAEKEAAQKVFDSLYDAPCFKHVSLVTVRHKKTEKLSALANLSLNKQKFLDSVMLTYQKASSSSNLGLLPLAEPGFLFYKGPKPDVTKTAWFSDGYTNATNHWDVSPQPSEKTDLTHYQKFCWELGLLMYSLSAPREHRRFIYSHSSLGELTSVFSFCNAYSLEVQLYASTDEEATKIIEMYDARYKEVVK